MGMTETTDREGVTVHTMNHVQGQGPVYYAALPRDIGTPTGRATNKEETRCRLVSALWDHLVAQGSSLWKCSSNSARNMDPIRVARDQLGKPHLLRGEFRGPAISFSGGGGNVWAALSGDESDLGIDVALAEEFQGNYPVHRVFHPEELHHALRVAGGDLAQASALLWSVKEAVVKALGCAFHLVEPRHVTVYPSEAGVPVDDGWHSFPVGLSGKALVRYPLAVSRSLRVRSRPQSKQWFSIAVLNREPTGHE
jgi:phosphopantetheinyl transferase